MSEKEINIIIKRILFDIQKREVEVDDIDVSDGILGISLFYLLYSKLYNNAEALDVSVNIVARVISRLNSGYTSSKLWSEIIELGKYLIYLKNNNISIDGIDDTLEEIDQILEDYLITLLKEENFDTAYGAISVGYYFIARLKIKPSKAKTLVLIFQSLKSSRKSTKNHIYWPSWIEETDNVQLGYMHGTSGILNFLTELARCKVIIVDNLSLVNDVSLALISSKFSNIKNSNLYPKYLGSSNEYYARDICYGDLGIGFALYNSGEILKSKRILRESEIVLKHFIDNRQLNTSQINDASLLYGSSGLMSYFNLLSMRTLKSLYKNESMFWKNKTINYASHENNYAGFDFYWNPEQIKTKYTYSNGISGVGCALISERLKDFSFLQFLNYY